jgi:predicted branched-subunit amino acid permease
LSRSTDRRGELNEDTSRYLAGARAGLPFALAVVVLGIYFGVLARSLGWGALAPIAFSIAAFSGAAQFAVAAVLGAGGGVFAAFFAAVFLNARFDREFMMGPLSRRPRPGSGGPSSVRWAETS